VPGVNIARSEAAERAKHLSIESYDVSLDLTVGSEIFLSTSRIVFTCNTSGYKTFVDAVGKSIKSATLNGAAVDTSRYDGETLHIEGLANQNELIIVMEGQYSNTGEGLQRSVDPVDQEVYLYSQGETAYIRKMYACFDQPSLKAEFTFHVTAPAHWEVISNNPVSTKVEAEGKSHWSFTKTPRISTYVTAVVAGPYAHVHDTYVGKKTVPLGIYLRKSLAKHLDADEIFTITKQGFKYFENVFGLSYPFDKYDQIAVVDFNWGAMENVGAVTFKENLLVFRSKVTDRMYLNRANTILHEMAHMWFGNLVTMSWWDDLWLNESFAEWSSYLAMFEATKFKNSWSAFSSERKNWAYRQDQLISTHPIVTDMVDIEAVNANFDGISYAKGASVLHQLAAYVGRDNFIAALQAYFAKYAFKNTTLQDLLTELEAQSGRDLKPWVATWLQTAGVNTLRPQSSVTDGKYTSVEILQEHPLMPIGSKELRIHRLAVGLYDIKGNDVVLRKSIKFDLEGSSTVVSELAGEPVADLLLVNDQDLSYAKVRLEDRSIATLKSHLGEIQDGLTRTVCWSAVWDMLRDAELSATDFLDIAMAGLAGEDDITTVTTLGNQIYGAIENYVHPDKRAAKRASLAEFMGTMMDSAKPGSDFQLQYARIFTMLADTPTQAMRIRELLDGKLIGLEVDVDLRWTFVKFLVEQKVFAKSEIEAELARDNTFTGQLSYETCLAEIYDGASKRAIWNSIINDDLPTEIRRSKISGFVSYRQRELLEEFVDDYFGILNSVWGKKSFEIGESIVEGLYPSYIAKQSTLDKTDAWLSGAGKSAPDTLRRLVAEGRDGLARALRAQAVDA
jgi:aminopeptidase N